MWTLHKQLQHRGAQLHARSGRTREAGEAPVEATRDRTAQEHDEAGDGALPAGAYPASPLEHGTGDSATGLETGAPAAPGGTDALWDAVVQPEQQQTELEQDERDDAARRERSIEQDADELDEAERAGPGS